MFEQKKRKLTQGDELPPGVQKMVKVYVAVKRRLQPATRWPDATATRAWSRRSFRSRTCPTWPTARGRHRAESARRAVADERRADLEVHLGWRRRASPQDRRHAEGAGEGRDIRRFLSDLHRNGKPEDLDSLTDAEILVSPRTSRRASVRDPRLRRRHRGRDQEHARARGLPTSARSRCTTAAPARRSTDPSPSATCTC